MEYEVADDWGGEEARESEDIGQSVDVFVDREDGGEALGEGCGSIGFSMLVME